MKHAISVIDSHTGGEPTRVIIEGGPNLGSGSAAEQLVRFRDDFDHFRSATVNEPRGSEAVVGAILLPSQSPQTIANVIFFNNVGYLGMCVHGTIGVMVTLAHCRDLKPGEYNLDTPVGQIQATLRSDGKVTVRNVPSYRTERDISIDVAGLGVVTGDVAWGGNWFFLTNDHGQALELANRDQLTEVAWRIRQALVERGIHGSNGHEIDHIELFGPPRDLNAHSRNFVLCPGKAYDRSPCGTGTSAKLACLAEDGLLAEGHVWRQESIIGSIFDGTYVRDGDAIIPLITGSAHITAESKLLLLDEDPFRFGIRA